MIQYAVISDIHGNIWALEAVLKDIAHRGIERIFNLGDSLYGPLEPEKTAEYLSNQALVNIMGNEDIILIEQSRPPSATLEYVLNDVTAHTLKWLAASHVDHFTYEDEIYLCHAAPSSKHDYLVEAPGALGSSLIAEHQILEKLSSIDQPIILCGHSHIPRTVRLTNGQLIINPGSVGLPAYDDNLPIPHKMETGSPHARYAVLKRNENGWRVEQIALPYDWEKAAKASEKRNRHDWAAWLRSGRA